MAEFPFNAKTMTTDWSTIFPDALVCAQHLYDLPDTEYFDFEDLCDQATIDPATYDKLWKRAKTAPSSFSDKGKLLLFELFFVKGRPNSNAFPTAAMNNKFAMIARILKRDYTLNTTRSIEGTQTKESAASILHEVCGGERTEAAIAQVLRQKGV